MDNDFYCNLKLTLGFVTAALSLILIILILWAFFPSLPRHFVREVVLFGKRAKEGQFPYAVNLGPSLCGGTIIHRNWIITSARCIQLFEKNITIYAGVVNKEYFKTATKRSSTEQFINPEFKGDTILHDIGLMFVKRPFPQSETIKPASLPSKDKFELPTTTTALGWAPTGSNNCTRQYPKLLYKSRGTAKKKNNTIIEMFSRRFPRVKPCYGDAGSGLIDENQNSHVLIGVNTATDIYPCGDPEQNYYYVNVTHYLDWIKTTMEKKTGDDGAGKAEARGDGNEGGGNEGGGQEDVKTSDSGQGDAGGDEASKAKGEGSTSKKLKIRLKHFNSYYN